MPSEAERLLGLAEDAKRPALKARVGLSGPPGSGKTKSALIMATELAQGGPLLVIDTEKESALTYADDFTFKHLRWTGDYDPRTLGDVIVSAGQGAFADGVIIVDSASHFWRKKGGVLDIAGGKYTGWKEARSAQEDLVESILLCRAHVIICSRAKMEHVQEQEANGQWKVRKLGMAAVQDDDLEYELNVALEIDTTHTIVVAKSRSDAVPVGTEYHAGHAGEFAQRYRQWLEVGEPPADQATVARMVEKIGTLSTDVRRACKEEFVARIGRPEHLREARVKDAWDLIAGYVAEDALITGTAATPGEALSGQDSPQEAQDEPTASDPPQEPPATGSGPESAPDDAPEETGEVCSGCGKPITSDDSTMRAQSGAVYHPHCFHALGAPLLPDADDPAA